MELKTCPFCGSLPKIRICKRLSGTYAEIECSCPLLMRTKEKIQSAEEVYEDAVRLWNTRFTGDQMNYKSDHGFKLSYAHKGDAGMDLRSAEDAVILPGGRETIGTGIHIELPKGTVGYVMPRSGLAAKHGITVLNSPGVVDEGYRGEIKATIHNAGFAPFEIRKGDRIAQLVVAPYAKVFPELVESLSETERGNNGFGSTGVK